MLWFGFASQVVAESLRSDVDLERVVGKRSGIPIFMGFENVYVSLGC